MSCPSRLTTYKMARQNALDTCTKYNSANGSPCYCTNGVMKAMVPFFNDCYSSGQFRSQDAYYSSPDTFQRYCYTLGIPLAIAGTSSKTTQKPRTTVAASPSGGGGGGNGSASSQVSGNSEPTNVNEESELSSGTDSGSAVSTQNASRTSTTSATPTATTTDLESTGSQGTPLGIPIAGWVGIGVGALVVLLLLCLFVTRLCNKARRNRNSNSNELYNGSNDLSVTANNTTASRTRDVGGVYNSTQGERESQPKQPPRAFQPNQNIGSSQTNGAIQMREVGNTGFDMPPATAAFAATAAVETTKSNKKEPTRLIDLDDDERSITSSQQAPSFFDVYSNPTATTTVGPAYSNPSLGQPYQHRASMPYAGTPLANSSFPNSNESYRPASLPPVPAFDSVYNQPKPAVLEANNQQHRNSFADAYGGPVQRPVSLQQAVLVQQQQQQQIRHSYAGAIAAPILPNQAMTSDPFDDSSSSSGYNMRPTSFAEAYSKPINRDSFTQHRGSNPFDDAEAAQKTGERRQSFMDVYSQQPSSSSSSGTNLQSGNPRRDSFVDVYGNL
ncbi:hypothetical protein BDR26DRAFT_860421 [Obelidium mucronatum]|nr:hypothetical protein BDR26DRAFT_860421 [Obelidium mucronatum]